MKEKVKNYSDEQVARLYQVYNPEASELDRMAQVASLVEELEKSQPSVIAKLTREKLYVPKAKAPAGKNPIKKDALVTLIAQLMEVDEDVIGSLEKATKNTLNILVKALTPSE